MKHILTKATYFASALFAVQTLTATPSNAVETHGYLRTGIGASQGGADQSCYQAPGSEAKARLGNECETYIELGLKENFSDGESAPNKLSSTVTLALVSGQNKDWESTNAKVDSKSSNVSQELTLSLREAFIEGQNFFGPNAKVWIGKRYYQRQDIHMLDYYFLNNSGPGVGVTDIKFENTSFSAAITRNTPAPDTDAPAQTNFDLRLASIPFLFSGTLETAFIYGAQSKTGNKTGEKNWEAMNGQQLALMYRQPTAIGQNLLVLQYGVGVFGANLDGRGSAIGDFGSYGSNAVAKDDSDRRDEQNKSSTLRLIEHLAFTLSPSLNGEFVALYQTVDFGGHKQTLAGTEQAVPNKTELTIGARPTYHFSETHAIAFEVAHTQVENAVVVGDDFKNAYLQKYTIAPQLTPSGNYWARPQLRVFGTYAQWNDDTKGSVASGSAHADNTSGLTIGAQVEAWW